MTRVFLFSFLLLLTASYSVAASELDELNFSHDIRAQIYQPDPHKEHAQQKFPTLYIMDGQHFIHSAIGYQQTLNWRNASSPEFVVVAIDTSVIGDSSARRRELLNNDSAVLMEVIENEIIPHVEAHYPVSNLRLFAGWENSGGFALDLLSNRPHLFDSFLFASSPNLSGTRMNKLEVLLSSATKTNSRLNKKLYLALGSQEGYAIEAFTQLNELSKAYPEQLQTKYELSSELSHFTTPLDLFTHGLAWVFDDYPAVNFYDISDLHSFGGVTAVKRYFQRRAERYHVSSEVAENTKFTMARHAVDANSLDLFLTIENELGHLNHEVFPPYWAHFFVSFLLEHKKYERAEEIMASALLRHPEVPQLLELNQRLQDELHEAVIKI